MARIPAPFAHQKTTSDFISANKHVYVTSDPGTGKTRSMLDAFRKRIAMAKLANDPRPRMLVFAPLSILQSSWGDDIMKFTPDLSYSIAYAKNREEIFGTSKADIVITNHDAAKWFYSKRTGDRTALLQELGFTDLCIDELTAFKNRTSQRSKAMARIAQRIPRRVGMTGTPNPNTVLDLWHQLYIVDGGERLGPRFFSFRSKVCTPRFNGFANEWVDKDGASDTIAASIMDINIRYTLEECLDMPDHSVHTMYVDLPKKIQKAYDELAAHSVLQTEGGETMTAIHAGAKVKKLLQVCTGAVYDENGKVISVHKERYNLVLDLVQERAHSLVAFNYTHERDYLIAEAEKRGYSYAVIDGTVNAAERTRVVTAFQKGEYKVLFAHPQSAGHGLTLTKATSTIWCSPTYNAEHYTQFNRRIYRAGQTQKTETICVAARKTWETEVYNKLGGKVASMNELLGTLKLLTGV